MEKKLLQLVKSTKDYRHYRPKLIAKALGVFTRSNYMPKIHAMPVDITYLFHKLQNYRIIAVYQIQVW